MKPQGLFDHFWESSVHFLDSVQTPIAEGRCLKFWILKFTRKEQVPLMFLYSCNIRTDDPLKHKPLHHGDISYYTFNIVTIIANLSCPAGSNCVSVSKPCLALQIQRPAEGIVENWIKRTVPQKRIVFCLVWISLLFSRSFA